MKWENKLSHRTYSASRLVYEVPGPISPGYRPFAPLALRKTCPNSLAIEQVNRSGKLSQNVLIFEIKRSAAAPENWRYRRSDQCKEDDRSISTREMQIDLSLQKSNRLAQILDAIHAVLD